MTVPAAHAADAAREGGRPPDLLFCRGCGGSIPRREFLAGRALLVEGRAWCPSCAPGMLSRRRNLRVVLGAAAFLAALALGLAVNGAVAASLEARDRARAAAESARSTRTLVEESRRRIDALDAEARGLSRLVEEMGRASEASRREGRAERDGTEDRLEGIERLLEALRDAVEAIRRDLAPARGAPRLTEEEERALLERLDDVNAGVRFEALWALQRGSGEAARRAAVKGLSDPQDSVRWQAATLARLLRAVESVPALVDCLPSASVLVRKEALEALRAIEGTDLGFDPLEPSVTRRAEAVLRWRERLKGR